MLNFAYLTGYDGTIKDYLFKSFNYLGLRKEKKELIKRFNEMVKKEKPDLILLIELKRRQIHYFLNKEYRFYDVESKYGKKSWLRKIPLIKNNCNAFISNRKIEFERHFLTNGTKKLIYEVKLPNNIRVIMTHFSLNRIVRERQFNEIVELTKEDEHLVVCGDFNIFSGDEEIKELNEKRKLKILPNSPTLPSFKPSKKLDLFLCSRKLDVKARVLSNVRISDHLPVVLEIKR